MSNDTTIDNAEVACMRGHSEARDRLLRLDRWDTEGCDTLERAVDSYEDYARCVVDEIRYSNLQEDQEE